MALSNDERGRITARVPQTVQDTLQQAADLLGASLNQFIVQAALSEARRVIEHDRSIELSGKDAAFLIKLLDRPAKPNARLKRAIRRYEALSNAGNPALDWQPRPKRVRQRKRAA
jgi:uncharacterized protein (DUF1778 family)